MKYIDAEKLKAEIDNVRHDWLDNSIGLEVGESGAELGAAESILDSIDEIIASLQQEQPEVDLKKEVSNYLKIHHLHIKDGGRVVFDNDDSPNFIFDITDIARHFYELGRARKEE